MTSSAPAANAPLLSVIIPAYNAAGCLAEAVESIRRQEYEPLEIVIVDDGSSDETARTAASLPGDIRYIYQEHTGRPAAGRNRGVRESAGSIVGFLDQDDLWPEDKLAVQLPPLLAEPAPDVVLGLAQILRLKPQEDGSRVFEPDPNIVDYTLLSSALFKRPVFETVGPFDESLAYFGDDLDWFIRAGEKGVSIHRLEAVTLCWRIHGSNAGQGASIRDHARGYDRALTEVLKRALDRKRS
jgi:glycosyltransferase involved in cell wall biosynthesis